MKLREKKIVLVAEDRLDNREILVTYLEELGYETRTADNGETGGRHASWIRKRDFTKLY